MTTGKQVFATFLALCVLVVVVYIANTENLTSRREKEVIIIYNNGYTAFKAGVPANANPHLGKYPEDAQHWLDGWISSKIESNKGNVHNATVDKP